MGNLSEGATISIGGVGIATLDSISWTGFEVDSIEVSTHGAGVDKTFIRGLVDPGQIDIEGNFLGANPTHIATAITGVLGGIQSVSAHSAIIVTDGQAVAVMTGTGFVSAFSWTGAVHETDRFTATIKLSGAVTCPS